MIVLWGRVLCGRGLVPLIFGTFWGYKWHFKNVINVVVGGRGATIFRLAHRPFAGTIKYNVVLPVREIGVPLGYVRFAFVRCLGWNVVVVTME